MYKTDFEDEEILQKLKKMSESPRPSTPLAKRRTAYMFGTTVPEEKTDAVTLIKPSERSESINEQVNKVDVVFSFDTTGSMRSVLESVRTNLTETIVRLFHDIEGIRIGIITHGDYIDHPNIMYKLDLTTDVDAIKNIIKTAPNTMGGDYPECYELVLREASNMDWKADVKVLVVIGDAEPHEFGYSVPHWKKIKGFEPTLHIDWKNEMLRCKEKGITIFSCHAMPDTNEKAVPFYTKISSETGGYYFPLDELQAFKDYMVAICMRAADGADDMLLLKQRQNELLEKLQKAENEEMKRNIEVESQEISEAIHVAHSEGIFTSPSSNVANNIRSARKLTTRVASFENELSQTTPSFFKNRSSTEFMNVIQNKSLSQPAFSHPESPHRTTKTTANDINLRAPKKTKKYQESQSMDEDSDLHFEEM